MNGAQSFPGSEIVDAILRAFTFPSRGRWRNCAQIGSRDATVGHEAVRPCEIPGPPRRFWAPLFMTTRTLDVKNAHFGRFLRSFAE